MKTIGKIFLWIFILALASEHPQVLGIVAIWLGWKVYHKYWLPQLAENKQLEALSQKTQLEIKLRSFISEYLKAFTSIWDVWPTKIVLNNYDYTSIRNLITKEKGIDSSILSEPEFNKIVDDQLYQAGYELFFKSFTKQIEQIVASSVKPAIMSKEFLIGAYYATFAQNKTYINFLASFSVNYGCPMQAAEIEIALTKLNQRIAIEKRSDSIKAAVASGGSVMKNILIPWMVLHLSKFLANYINKWVTMCNLLRPAEIKEQIYYSQKLARNALFRPNDIKMRYQIRLSKKLWRLKPITNIRRLLLLPVITLLQVQKN